MSPEPDSPIADKVFPSPNHGERRGTGRIEALVLHYTGMADEGAALAWLANPVSQVSCHYFVFENGRVLQLVPESRRAWHAGAGRWDTLDDLNSHSIGIEIANPGHEHGYRAFPAIQMRTVVALCADIVGRHAIPRHRVIGHSDMAPQRKDDPGELFDWRALATAGVGLYVPPAPLGGGRFLSPGDQGKPVAALQDMLAMLGYECAASGQFDDATAAVVRAFQRHWRPARIDGVADRSTIETLAALVRQKLGTREEG